MITLDALLVFLGAAALPVIYLFICSRWIEAESRQSRPSPTAPKGERVSPHKLTEQNA